MNVFLRAFEHWLPLAAEDPETGRGGRPEGNADAGVRSLPRWQAGAACTLRRRLPTVVVNAAHLKDGKWTQTKQGPGRRRQLVACTLLFPDSEFQALSTRWAFQDPPGETQGSSRGDQGVRGAWAGLEAGQGRGWWGSLLGEGFEAANGLGL